MALVCVVRQPVIGGAIDHMDNIINHPGVMIGGEKISSGLCLLSSVELSLQKDLFLSQPFGVSSG